MSGEFSVTASSMHSGIMTKDCAREQRKSERMKRLIASLLLVKTKTSLYRQWKTGTKEMRKYKTWAPASYNKASEGIMCDYETRQLLSSHPVGLLRLLGGMERNRMLGSKKREEA